MWKLLQYYARYQGARSVLGGMPAWARLILLVAAAPGLVLIALSILAFLVSLLALLLLTVPLYRLLKVLTGAGSRQDVTVEEGDPPLASVDFVEPVEPPAPSVEVGSREASQITAPAMELEPKPPRRPIEVRIIE